nr:GNAT family N-acetyltransferase [Arthrobacter sp. YN]
MERQHQRLVDGTGYSFAIADSSSDQAVGQIGLWLKNLSQCRASIGYWVAPSHRGNPLRVASNHSPRASAGPASILLRRPARTRSKPQLFETLRL